MYGKKILDKFNVFLIGMFPLLLNKKSSTFIQDISENPAKAVYIILHIIATIFSVTAPILQFVINKQTEQQKNPLVSIQKQIKEMFPSLKTVVSFPLLILFGFISSFSTRQHRMVFFFPVQIMSLGVLLPTIIIKRDPKMVEFFLETVANPFVDIIIKTFATKVQPLERRSGLTVY